MDNFILKELCITVFEDDYYYYYERKKIIIRIEKNFVIFRNSLKFVKTIPKLPSNLSLVDCKNDENFNDL